MIVLLRECVCAFGSFLFIQYPILLLLLMTPVLVINTIKRNAHELWDFQNAPKHPKPMRENNAKEIGNLIIFVFCSGCYDDTNTHIDWLLVGILITWR